MSREIKFRALYDDMSFQWKYGMLIYEGSVPRIQQKGTMLFSTCLKGTEGQFTGLLDKNGVEIYEGDIIKSLNGQIKSATVVFEDAAFWYRYNDDMYGEQHEEICHWVSNRIAVEVIGNIYQNPELTSQPITTPSSD